MKIANILACSLTAAALLTSTLVHAGFETIQPASGYVWNGAHDHPGVTRMDGQVKATQPVTWVTPVQLSAYNINYSGSQSVLNVGGTVSTRLAGFDKDGPSSARPRERRVRRSAASSYRSTARCLRRARSPWAADRSFAPTRFFVR
jgi:hypothetical protein